ncbi:MAG: hypothetical protein BWY87_00615 [Deltaproteobacteria bacterium ADurb.Bin510]|nr:MAG: hypothetical protein BWY87_00615 [Deltaproteobacteria bacterium ADurb.Bin510]
MEVGPDLRGDLGEGLEVVDVAGLGGAGHAHHCDDFGGSASQLVFAANAVNGLIEFFDVDLVDDRNDRHGDDRILAQAEQSAGLANRIVAALGDQNNGPAVTVMLEGSVEALVADALEVAAVWGEGLGQRQTEAGQVGEGAVRGDDAQSDAVVVDVAAVEIFRTAEGQTVHPGQEFALDKGRGLGALDLHLILVEADRDHLEQNHEIRNGRGHVADVVGAGDLDRVLDDVVLDIVQHVLDEHGLFGQAGMVELELEILD